MEILLDLLKLKESYQWGFCVVPWCEQIGNGL
jgi:hypothetical protein